MKTFTINEIKNYLQQQNDLEHIKHNVTEKDIIKANKTVTPNSSANVKPFFIFSPFLLYINLIM
jgi:hypothetical protein